jgi:carbon-monoxide dehydrogenase large subunit
MGTITLAQSSPSLSDTLGEPMPSVQPTPTGSILGRAVRRTEDPRLLTGDADYVEDIPCEGALHAAFVRSTIAHARILSVDADAARSMPGVAGVFTAADFGIRPFTFGTSVQRAYARPILAKDVVRFVGEEVAVVVAETRVQATDAAEAILVEYDPLPVVVDPVAAIQPGAPLLFPDSGTNVAFDRSWPYRGKDPLSGSDVVVKTRFVNQRLAPAPMETNAILAVPEADGLKMWIPCQAPFWMRDEIADALGIERDEVRVIAPAVGGGFGAKTATYPEHMVVAALAHRLRRPVRCIETRSENLTVMSHGRAQVQDVELGAKRDGTLVGLRVRVVADMGAYPMGTYLPSLTRKMACGVYDIKRVDFHALSVVTNTTPIDSYRGAGRPEATALLERAVDMVAAELRLDPAEVRRRNLIPKDDFPVTTVTDGQYDSGDYGRALDEVLRRAGYEELRREQAERRARGDAKLLGIGISCYVELTGWGSEFGAVEVEPDGSVVVLTGVSPHGQGHETAFAQLASDLLKVPFDRVTVRHSDTAVVPKGDGTMGSRSLQLGGSAMWNAGEEVVEKARRIAAHLLEASVDDVELSDDGRVGIVGAPDRSYTWADLATVASDPSRLPEGVDPGLRANHDFDGGGNTYPFGAHVAVVEVDAETGRVQVLRHVAVDDCGRIINPMLVEGQQHGGIAQGMAQALFEEVVFDEGGNPLTGTLMSYEFPSAADLPRFETSNMETPSQRNPLGAKGIGESGTVGSTPAVQNAVIDAVSHLGVRHIDMPLSPERVWRAIREAVGE